jgi:hypothetical protein
MSVSVSVGVIHRRGTKHAGFRREKTRLTDPRANPAPLASLR